MKETQTGVLIGLFVGLVLGVSLTVPAIREMGNELDKHSKLITDCEKDKPRSIHCILTAVEKPQ